MTIALPGIVPRTTCRLQAKLERVPNVDPQGRAFCGLVLLLGWLPPKKVLISPLDGLDCLGGIELVERMSRVKLVTIRHAPNSIHRHELL